MNPRSKQVRRDTITLSKSNGGYHYGGCFSIIEILIALYDGLLTGNDKFILSKGHACWPLYVLLRERGLNPKLNGHPERDPINGIEFTTGSGGHGFPAGIGMALAKKLKRESGTVYVLLGDGECQEGTTWESLIIAAHHKLSNLTVIVDWNQCQGSGYVDEILKIDGLTQVTKAVGWSVSEIDGHSINEIRSVLPAVDFAERPQLIIAHTIKGKGVSFMEGLPQYHARWLSNDEEGIAMRELAE